MTMPSDNQNQPSQFDRFASAIDNQTSKAWFFVACVLLVLVWVPSFALLPIDTWQLIINTATTIITFLLVALLQNTQRRNGDALHQKLNAIALVLIDLAREHDDPKSVTELRKAIGLENESST